MHPGITQDALVLLFTKEEAFISHLPSDGYTAIQIAALILPKKEEGGRSFALPQFPSSGLGDLIVSPGRIGKYRQLVGKPSQAIPAKARRTGCDDTRFCTLHPKITGTQYRACGMLVVIGDFIPVKVHA